MVLIAWDRRVTTTWSTYRMINLRVFVCERCSAATLLALSGFTQVSKLWGKGGNEAENVLKMEEVKIL